MLPDLHLIPGSISEMVVSAHATGVITKTDRYGLMAAVLAPSLSEDESRAINRLLRNVKRGKVKMIQD